MGTYFRLCRISRLRFFRAWKIEILEFIQILHLAEAPMPPLPPHLPARCTWTGGALESTFHCYNLHFALILLFCCSRSQIAIKKDESTFRRLLFASVKQFQLKVN